MGSADQPAEIGQTHELQRLTHIQASGGEAHHQRHDAGMRTERLIRTTAGSRKAQAVRLLRMRPGVRWREVRRVTLRTQSGRVGRLVQSPCPSPSPRRSASTHCRGAGVDALSRGDRQGALNSIGAELLAAGVPAGRKILVVSNPDVAGPYGDRCLHSLRSSGFQVDLLVIEAGEERKTPPPWRAFMTRPST